MNDLIKRTAFLSAALFACNPLANAQDAQHEIGLTANNFGAGIFYGYEFSDQWTIRGVLTGLEIDDLDWEASGLDYEGKDDSSFNALIVDWRPFDGGWAQNVYFSGGIASLESELNGELTSIVGSNVNIGGAVISSSEFNGLTVDIDYEKEVTPYLGVGWRSKGAGESGVAFTAEIGFVHLDDPSISLVVDDPNNVLSQANIDAERDQISDDFSGGVSGFASIGLSYRF